MRGFAIISTNWFMPRHNETNINSFHISDRQQLCYYSMCESSTVTKQAWCCTPSPFLSFSSSPFTVSGVPPCLFSAPHHRQSYNFMFEWRRNIFLPRVSDIADCFAWCALKKLNKYDYNCNNNKKITVFSFNRNLYFVRVFLSLHAYETETF